MEFTEEYKNLLKMVKARFSESKQCVIAIDGSDYSGKSTVSRYLSWKTGVSLIELDMFCVPDKSDQTLNAYIQRLKSNRTYLEFLANVFEKKKKTRQPVIIEGIVVLEILKQCNIKPDFVIYMKNKSYENGSGLFIDLLEDYKNKYYSKYKPDHELSWAK